MNNDLQDMPDDELADWIEAYGNMLPIPRSRYVLFEAARRLREREEKCPILPCA